jgi:hypothetical protein
MAATLSLSWMTPERMGNVTLDNPMRPRKPKPKWDDPEQSRWFLEAAEAAEASKDPKDFEHVF